MMRLVLASGSPRRQALLKACGFDLVVVQPRIDESVRPHEPAEDYVLRLAGEKANAVDNLALPVVAADTAVVLKGKVLGKPQHEEEAKSMLRRLSGQEHEVMTGFVVKNQKLTHAEVVTTKVRFRELSFEEIQSYVLSKEGDDKAGSYAIQGEGAFLIDRIDGSYTNVVGLPLHEVIAALRGLNEDDAK